MRGSDVVPYGWDDAFIVVGGLPRLRRLPHEALEDYVLAVVEGREGDMLAMTLPYE
ncbi:hypothetical protein AB0G15_06165 [Streptosporangium sp. NPDC023825]|uniref:hypothetical protein n=1 Tax=Streptosporangium sp. NPDC023825 TaxID=3154909 RepID=UPI00343C39C6